MKGEVNKFSKKIGLVNFLETFIKKNDFFFSVVFIFYKSVTKIFIKWFINKYSKGIR